MEARSVRGIYKNHMAKTKFDNRIFYCLTPAGRKIAEKIVDEIDEYKAW